MPHLPRRTATAFAAVFGAIVLASCTDVTGPRSSVPLERSEQALLAARKRDKIKNAVDAQERHHARLMAVRGVIGTAVGLQANGDAVVQVLVVDNMPRDIPTVLDDSIPVTVRVTGLIMARSNPTLRTRPAPLGFSIGHPAITAGTIGARVFDASGVYVLSNNHVLANSNGASIGDAEYQPGPFDGGTSADQVGTLFAFKPLDFSGANNTFDAAIAVTDASSVGNATPDDAYGMPNGHIWGDANDDRVFDDRNALLGLPVMKYGRTTQLTHGTITGINASLDVCYEVVFIFCTKAAHFVDQIVITPAGFSDGGDSGSLIVTDNAEKNPVALLFAGSSTETIANRIDLVLNHFNVSIDATSSPPPPPPPPPDPVTDIAVNSITAPATVTQGNTATVTVIMKNVGNQKTDSTFTVTLTDQTDGVLVGTKFVGALNPGATWTLNYSWNTTSRSLGAHALVASSQLIDDNAANNTGTTTSTVVAVQPTVDVHIGNLTGTAMRAGPNAWSATVEITVHDASHNPLNGATVTGNWSRSGLNSNTCTTGELGGNGTCIVLFPGLPRSVPSVIFAVTGVAYPNRTYKQIQNHDPDGSSNGTGQKVNRP